MPTVEIERRVDAAGLADLLAARQAPVVERALGDGRFGLDHGPFDHYERRVTVVEPPQADGAPVLLFVKTPLQPPVPLAVANQVAKAVFTAACVWQAAAVVFVGQVSTTVGGAATVKVAVHVVVVGAQELV